VLCLWQGVCVAPSTRRQAQGQPPEADVVRWTCVVFGNDVTQRAGEARTDGLSVLPELLNRAGARQAQRGAITGSGCPCHSRLRFGSTSLIYFDLNLMPVPETNTARVREGGQRRRCRVRWQSRRGDCWRVPLWSLVCNNFICWNLLIVVFIKVFIESSKLIRSMFVHTTYLKTYT
jgi:hypothetical protein